MMFYFHIRMPFLFKIVAREKWFHQKKVITKMTAKFINYVDVPYFHSKENMLKIFSSQTKNLLRSVSAIICDH